MRHRINEAYGVKLGRGQPPKSFDTLESAVEFINAGMKKRDSDTYVLYNDNKEMIWLDRYEDRSGSSLGYTISRQDDKKTVTYDKQKGLLINNGPQDDESIRAIVVKEAGSMKHYNEAAKLAKFKFVVDTSKSSYIDFDANCVHYNTDEQLNEVIEELVKQLNSKTESLELEELEELFGLGKKAKKKYIVGISAEDAGNVNVPKLASELSNILRDYADNVKSYRSPREISAHRYFAHSVLYMYEFTCSEDAYNKIKTKVSRISPRQVANKNSNYGTNEINSTIRRLLSWSSDSSTYESLEEDADKYWYELEW
jgi:hypothetical protein